MEEENNVDSSTFADYQIVKGMIQKYYYNMIENHRRYTELRKLKKRNHKLRIYIQTQLETICSLLENYKSIMDSKTTLLLKDYKQDIEQRILLNIVFKHVAEFKLHNKIMKDEFVCLGIQAVSRAYIILGIGDIETQNNPSQAIVNIRD